MLIFEQYIKDKEKKYANLISSYRKNKSSYVFGEKFKAYTNGVRVMEADISYTGHYLSGNMAEVAIFIKDTEEQGISVIIAKILDRMEVFLNKHVYTLDTERSYPRPSYGMYIFQYKKEVPNQYGGYIYCMITIDTTAACEAVEVGTLPKYEYRCKEVA